MSRRSLFDIIQESDSYADKFLNDFIYTTEKLAENGNRKPSKTFKPSSIKCGRGAVLQVMGAELDKTTKSHNLFFICENGTQTHLLIQSLVTKMKTLGLNWEYEDVAKYVKDNNIPLEVISKMDISKGEYETKLFSKKFNCRFLCDGLLSYTDSRGKKHYMILEIKTIASHSFWGLKDVADKHKQQAISYCTLLHVDSILFLYQERDMMNKKTFLYTPTTEEKQEWISKLQYLNECVKSKIVPPKPIEADSKFCVYCQYKNTCKTIGKGVYLSVGNETWLGGDVAIEPS